MSEKTKLEKLEEQKKKLEEQIRKVKKEENEKKRKERTRNLIQFGALSAKYFGVADDAPPEEFENRLKEILDSKKIDAEFLRIVELLKNNLKITSYDDFTRFYNDYINAKKIESAVQKRFGTNDSDRIENILNPPQNQQSS